jgi:hypothetical protein
LARNAAADRNAATSAGASGPPPAPASAAAARGIVAPPPVPDSDRSAATSEVAERAPAPEAAPPRRVPVRANPRVAVIATGERTFAGAAEEALQSQLARHGIDLYNVGGNLELRDAGGASQVAPSDLLHLVASRGTGIMVLIDVEPLRETELQSQGRYSYATTSRVRVDAYLAADGDSIGRGWSEQVEYADLNAASKADASMGRFSTDIADAIAAAWQDFRSGAR